jgi:hypothetical protein
MALPTKDDGSGRSIPVSSILGVTMFRSGSVLGLLTGSLAHMGRCVIAEYEP